MPRTSICSTISPLTNRNVILYHNNAEAIMDCYICEKEIGSIAEPIFVGLDGERIVCRGCYTITEGHPPDEDEAEYDPEMVPQA